MIICKICRDRVKEDESEAELELGVHAHCLIQKAYDEFLSTNKQPSKLLSSIINL